MHSDHAWGDQIAATILRYMSDVSTVIKIHWNTCVLTKFNIISTETSVLIEFTTISTETHVFW